MSTSQTPEPQSKHKPEWHLRVTGLEASCWKSSAKADDATTRDFFTVTIQRSYKDKSGKWQHTQSLRRQDLLPMARLLEQAYDKLTGSAPDED